MKAKQCFITKQSGDKIRLICYLHNHGIFSSKREASIRCKELRKIDERKNEFQVHELERDRELYEELKLKTEEFNKRTRKLFREAYLEFLATPRKVITGETTHGTKWEIKYFPISFKGKIHYRITYTISNGTQFGVDRDLIPEELEGWIESHDPMVAGREYWAWFGK